MSRFLARRQRAYAAALVFMRSCLLGYRAIPLARVAVSPSVDERCPDHSTSATASHRRQPTGENTDITSQYSTDDIALTEVQKPIASHASLPPKLSCATSAATTRILTRPRVYSIRCMCAPALERITTSCAPTPRRANTERYGAPRHFARGSLVRSACSGERHGGPSGCSASLALGPGGSSRVLMRCVPYYRKVVEEKRSGLHVPPLGMARSDVLRRTLEVCDYGSRCGAKLKTVVRTNPTGPTCRGKRGTCINGSAVAGCAYAAAGRR